jgi:hypothetical protein
MPNDSSIFKLFKLLNFIINMAMRKLQGLCELEKKGCDEKKRPWKDIRIYISVSIKNIVKQMIKLTS